MGEWVMGDERGALFVGVCQKASGQSIEKNEDKMSLCRNDVAAGGEYVEMKLEKGLVKVNEML